MTGKAKFALWLLMGLVLSACGQRVGLAPVVHGGNGDTVPPESTISAVARQTVTVQRGDALYKIARRFNIRLRSLIDANDLKPPYTIFPGQKLSLPSSDVHVVRRGETVYQVANRYNTEPGTLVRLNRISPPYRLYPGQKIALPRSSGREASTAPGTRRLTTCS